MSEGHVAPLKLYYSIFAALIVGTLITVWVALTDTTGDNGCLVVAPGSHVDMLGVYVADGTQLASVPGVPVPEDDIIWTLEPAGGRVFVSIPGHYSWTFDDPLFRTLLLRG